MRGNQHGHPFFYVQTQEEEKLHSDKNHDYAAGGDALGNFNRVAAILSLYPGLDPAKPVVVALTYALKQLDAVLWGLAKSIKHKVEGLHPRLQDISVYAKLARCILKDEELGRANVELRDQPRPRKNDILIDPLQQGVKPMPSDAWDGPSILQNQTLTDKMLTPIGSITPIGS